MEVSGQHTPRPLYPAGNKPRYPPNMRLIEVLRQFERYAGKKNRLLLSGIEPRFLCHPVA
jgi:hypothetical protein